MPSPSQAGGTGMGPPSLTAERIQAELLPSLGAGSKGTLVAPLPPSGR